MRSNLTRLADDSPERQIPWLPGERFELALHARNGAITGSAVGRDILTITTHRAIQLGADGGKRITSLVPLDRITGIEVVDVARPSQRLSQGLVALGIGIALGWVSWAVAGVALISLVVGGLPLLVAVYMLSSYAFPDDDGELVLHAGGHALRQPLLTSESRRDAYLVAHRVYELIATRPPSKPEDSNPVPAVAQVAEQPAPQPTATEIGSAVESPKTTALSRNGAHDQLASLLKLPPAVAGDGDTALPDVGERIAQCIAGTERATSYISRQVVRDPDRESMGEGDYVWDVDFAKPDSFRVSQTGWSSSGEVHDEWLAIGDEFFRHSGGWKKPDDLTRFEAELALNRHLTVDKYLPLLRQAYPTSAGALADQLGGYLVVSYDHISRDTLAGILDNPSPPQSLHGSATIWIESDSGLLAKAEVLIEAGGGHLLFEQAFAAYDTELGITRPDLQPAPEVAT